MEAYYKGRIFKDKLDNRASLMAQVVKNLSAVWETWIWSLGWEDPLKKEMATQSSILAGESDGQGEWQATVHGVTKSWTRLSDLHFHFRFQPKIQVKSCIKPNDFPICEN